MFDTKNKNNYYVDIDALNESHTSIEDFVSELEQEGWKDDLRQARSWIADTYYNEDGDTVKTVRLRKGLSQSDLATLMNTRQAHISRIEKARKTSPIATLFLLNVRRVKLTNHI